MVGICRRVTHVQFVSVKDGIVSKSKKAQSREKLVLR